MWYTGLYQSDACGARWNMALYQAFNSQKL